MAARSPLQNDRKRHIRLSRRVFSFIAVPVLGPDDGRFLVRAADREEGEEHHRQ